MSSVMERREHVRYSAQFPAEFTIVGSHSPSTPAQVRDVSEGGFRLAMGATLPVGALIRLEVADMVVFGEVRYSCPWMGGYIAGLCVERVLVGESEMSKLIALTLKPHPASDNHNNAG